MGDACILSWKLPERRGEAFDGNETDPDSLSSDSARGVIASADRSETGEPRLDAYLEGYGGARRGALTARAVVAAMEVPLPAITEVVSH